MNTHSSVETGQSEHPQIENEFQVDVLLFASLKDAVGTDHIHVRLPYSADKPVAVSEFLIHCGQQFPALGVWLPHVKVAVNHTYAETHQTVQAGDEIALLPPVSGGAGSVIGSL